MYICGIFYFQTWMIKFKILVMCKFLLYLSHAWQYIQRWSVFFVALTIELVSYVLPEMVDTSMISDYF